MTHMDPSEIERLMGMQMGFGPEATVTCPGCGTILRLDEVCLGEGGYMCPHCSEVLAEID